MALQSADFIEPSGDLLEEQFPGRDLEAYVQQWITGAEAETSEEEAQTAYVYWKAYAHLASRLSFNPSQVDVEHKGSKQTLVSQMQAARDLRDEWKAKFRELTETETKTSNFRVRSPSRPGDGRRVHPEYYSGR